MNLKKIINNKEAVVGLPMRLMVSIIIGTIALAFIISYVTNPFLFPQDMKVSINPFVHIVDSENPTEINIKFNVNDSDNKPIEKAEIIIKGVNTISNNYTDQNGVSTFNIIISMDENLIEDYLDVKVKKPGFNTYSKNDLIKIVKQ